MAELTFETKIDFGGIGGRKKLTFTSWNNNAPRYDIRDWYENGSAGKGITLDVTELQKLFEILKQMDENGQFAEKEEPEEMPFGDSVEETKAEETTEEPKEFPKAVQKVFETLDKLFEGFEITKDYGEMPFAKGNRVQYTVAKSKKKFPKYEDTLEKLKLKSFVTNKGNLYIYTL